jgi:hypothetical protein
MDMRLRVIGVERINSAGDTGHKFFSDPRRFMYPVFFPVSSLAMATVLLVFAVAQACRCTIDNHGVLPPASVSFLFRAVETTGALMLASRFVHEALSAVAGARGLPLVDLKRTPTLLVAAQLGNLTSKHFGIIDD